MKLGNIGRTLANAWRRLFNHQTVEQVLFGNTPPSTNVSGVRVTESNSLQQSAVWACVERRAETVAALPLNYYQFTPEGQVPRPALPQWSLFRSSPAPGWDSFAWLEFMQACLDLWGNAFALKVLYDRGPRAGQVKHLLPFLPTDVSVFRTDGRWLYFLTDTDGRQYTVMPDQLFHIKAKALRSDSPMGLSRVAYHRQTVGLAVAQETHGAAFFGNGARPGGALVNDNRLTDAQKDAQRASWNAIHRGAERAHRIAVLDQGTKFQTITMPNDDAQWLEARGFSTEDIARIFNVPGPLIGHLAGATLANVEQLTLNFQTTFTGPNAERWQHALNWQVLTELQRKAGYFWQFVIEATAAADLAAKSAFFREMFYVGAMSQNDIRSRIGLNRISGGDTYYVPANLVDSTEARPAPRPDQAAAPARPDDPPGNQAVPAELVRAVVDELRDRVERLAEVENKATRKAAKTPDQFLDAIEAALELQRERLGGLRHAVDAYCQAHNCAAELELDRLVDCYVSGRLAALLDVAQSATPANLAALVDAHLEANPGGATFLALLERYHDGTNANSN